jgi:AraC-like DNA-binding protein
MKTLTKGTYYGSMKKERNENGIILSEYDYFEERTDWHFHENPYFMYVLEGDMMDCNKKVKTLCPSGSLMFNNWQEPHYGSKHSDKARGFHMEFERSWFEKSNIDIALWEGSQLIRNPKLHHILAKLYAEFKYADAYSEVSIELLIAELCDNIEKESVYKFKGNPLWLAPFIEIVHQNIEPLNLKYLSDKLGIHPGHLSRAVPKYFSTTLGDYIRQIKTKKAVDLMLSTKASLFDISYQCGFSDQSHFTRTFKKYFGMTPKQFKKKCD